jgi:hypothetical protein
MVLYLVEHAARRRALVRTEPKARLRIEARRAIVPCDGRGDHGLRVFIDDEDKAVQFWMKWTHLIA